MSESVRGVSDPRASVVRSGFNSVLRKPPLGSRGEQTDRAVTADYWMGGGVLYGWVSLMRTEVTCGVVNDKREGRGCYRSDQ